MGLVPHLQLPGLRRHAAPVETRAGGKRALHGTAVEGRDAPHGARHGVSAGIEFGTAAAAGVAAEAALGCGARPMAVHLIVMEAPFFRVKVGAG